MKTKIRWAFFAAVFGLALGLAGAEEKLGVQVYPGSKPDADVAQFLSSAMSMEAYCYRTADGAAKVVDFYKKQPGLTYQGGDEKGGMLKKGDVTVTIQNPWMDMKTGKMVNDTLITIAKEKGEILLSSRFISAVGGSCRSGDPSACSPPR